MQVTFCGTRGSTPAPGAPFVRYGGHTSCVALATDGRPPSLILDAGTGIRTVTALLDGAPFVGPILLTHLHWDHVQGLPFFAAGDREGARVELFVPEPDDGRSARDLLAEMMSPPHFPIAPEGLRGKWSFEVLGPGAEWEAAPGWTVRTAEVRHKGGRTLAYRVTDGSATVVYVPDHCPTADGPGPDGWGEYPDDLLALAESADLLIHDAHLLPEELAAEAAFGHAAADYAVALGRRASARSVALFHHRPDRTDDALDVLGRRLGRRPGRGAPGVVVARDAMVVDLATPAVAVRSGTAGAPG